MAHTFSEFLCLVTLCQKPKYYEILDLLINPDIKKFLKSRMSEEEEKT